MPDVAEDFENAVNAGYLILIIAALGIAAYVGYEVYKFGSSASDALKKLFSAGAADPGGGSDATSVAGAVANQALEIGTSSMSYSDAASQTVSNPTGTASSILGLSQGETSLQPSQDDTNVALDSGSGGLGV